MLTFTLHIPKLTEEQQIQLEETLLKVPQVDAFVLTEAGDVEITSGKETLRDMAAALYSWASNYTGMLLSASVSCQGKEPMVLGKHSPNEMIHYLVTCHTVR